MASYTVKKGDTMTALARRALKANGVSNPTQAQINSMIRTASVPSGNRNLIRPGERINFRNPGSAVTEGGRSRMRTSRAPRSVVTEGGRTGGNSSPTKKAAAKKATSSGNATRSRTSMPPAKKTTPRKAASGGTSRNTAGSYDNRAAGSAIAQTPAARPIPQTYASSATSRNTSTRAGLSAQQAARGTTPRRPSKPRDPNAIMNSSWAQYGRGRRGR